MKKVIISFIFLFTFIFFASALAPVKADVQTTPDLQVLGAQVRTTGNPGIRFAIKFESDTLTPTAYGAVAANGVANISEDFVIGGKVNGFNTTSTTVNEVDGEGMYYMTIVNVPNTDYLTDVTIRPFVICDDVYYYGSSVATRSLGQVVNYAANDGVEGDIITEVQSSISSDKKAYKDGLNTVIIDSALYETNYQILAQRFIEDWNAKFSTNLSTSAFVSVDYDSPFKSSAKSGEQTDYANSRLYQFFADPVMSEKWGFVLTGIANDLNYNGNTTYVKPQVQLLQGDTSKSSSWYFGYHVISLIQSYFAGVFSSTGYNGYNFANNPEKSYLISKRNNHIFADLTNVQTGKVGDSIILPSELEKEYYTNFKWGTYNPNSEYVLTADNVQLLPSWSPAEYSITYMDGLNVLNLAPASYNIETNNFELPTYEKAGYVFEGWYENAEFTGSTVESIAKGSHGNKVFYAKMEKTDFVDVNTTFNTNGGMWEANEIIHNNVATTSLIATRYNTYDSPGNEIAFIIRGQNGLPRWWQFVVLEFTASPNVYKILGKANGSTALPDQYDAVILYYSGCKSEYKSQMDSIYNGSNTGSYIVLDNVPATNGSGKEVEIKLYSPSVVTANINKVNTIVEELPTPHRTGYTFNGWLNGLDSQVYTEFPGYYSNPGDIIYTAQWSPIQYSITYMDEDTPINLAPSSYNIETETFNLPNYSKAGFIFKGWYDNSEFTGSSYTSILLGTVGNKVLYAKMAPEGFTVTLDFNGGNTKYASYDAVTTDYLTDYNAYAGKSYSKETYSAIGAWDEIGTCTNFFYNQLDKWGWLVDFFAINASSANKPAYKVFKNYSTQSELKDANGNYIYEIAYEPRGWVGGILWDKNANFNTSDWSQPSRQALALSYLSSIEQTVFDGNLDTVNITDLIGSNIYKEGYTFGGWYDNPEFTGSAVTSASSDVTLYAKWIEN